jgi:hypothetical protein
MLSTTEPGQHAGDAPSTAWADLEIGLDRRDADGYAATFRFVRPDSATDDRVEAAVRIEFDRLRAALLDAPTYGRSLSESLFESPAAREAFGQARAAAQAIGEPLRLRLFIGAGAPELHALRWELLSDPRDGTPLLTSEELFFSRYLSSSDWRPVRRRPRASLRALVAVAAPSDVADFGLAPFDAAGQLAEVAAALGDIPATALASPGQATAQNLFEHLRLGPDILYLVCHGTVRGEPWLWLEDEHGKAARLAGREFAARLKDLAQRPRLIVLASCRSAGGDLAPAGAQPNALAALGPLLAEAGVPAVVAMQGDISVETVARFMPAFFRELQRDGQVDRAMTVARGAARDRPDGWMPVLFMRLRDGRLWYVPGFRDQQREFEHWPALVRNIQEGACTPIVGWGINEALLGSSHEIARNWAERYRFPLEAHDRENLASVAQYLAVNQDYQFVRTELRQYLREEVLRRHGRELPAELQEASFAALFEEVGRLRRQRDPAEPNRALAQMPFPLYITTNPDNFLAAALAEAGREPRVLLCPWNDAVEQSTAEYDGEPTVQRPLVYHLFGQLARPETIVVTEDDYFDYLIGVTSNRDLIPAVVRRAQAASALLFLGFQVDDWKFRVLFRSIMRAEGGGRRLHYRHIAVQIDPDEGRILDPERARHYLESYFQDAKISIYWGSTDDFVRELLAHWERGVGSNAPRA